MVYTVKEENMMERVKKGDMWGEKKEPAQQGMRRRTIEGKRC